MRQEKQVIRFGKSKKEMKASHSAGGFYKNTLFQTNSEDRKAKKLVASEPTNTSKVSVISKPSNLIFLVLLCLNIFLSAAIPDRCDDFTNKF